MSTLTDRKVTGWEALWVCPTCNGTLKDGVDFAICDPKEGVLKVKAVAVCPHCGAIICEREISIVRLEEGRYKMVAVGV